jgi:hypothetical protein
MSKENKKDASEKAVSKVSLTPRDYFSTSKLVFSIY